MTSLRMRVVEAGIVKVVTAAKAMRKSHISLFPRPEYALTDADGLARLSVDDVVRLTVDAMLDFLAREFPDGDEAAFVEELREDR